MSDATHLALSAILEELRAIRATLDLLTLEPENRPLARDIAVLTRAEADGIEALTERFEALRAELRRAPSAMQPRPIAFGTVRNVPRQNSNSGEQIMKFTLSLSALNPATATQQQIAARLDAQQAESIDAQRSLLAVIKQQHAAERLALEARCGELGHVFRTQDLVFGGREVQCCAICGVAAPKAA